MKKAIVTGSSGFIGSALCNRLTECGVEVVPVDVLTGIDIADPKAVRDVMEQHKPDTVFHLAGVTTTQFAEQHPASCMMINVVGTVNVLQESLRCAVNRVVLSGTYLEPTEPYSISKWTQKHLGDFYQDRGLSIGLLSHCNVYGPGDTNKTRLIPATILSALANKPPVVHSDTFRAFVFIEDLIHEYVYMGQETEEHREVIRKHVHILTIVKLILRLMDSDLEPVLEFESPKEYPVNVAQDQTPLQTGLTKTIAWYTEHQKDFQC